MNQGSWLVALAMIFSGCSTWSGVQERYLICSYDHVWEAALTSVKNRSVVVKDKEHGVIQTAWLEIPMPGRSYGAFSREVQNSRDRSRILMNLARMNDVTKVSMVEEREAWAFRGGARMFGWVPTNPSPEVMQSVQHRMDHDLKEHGCSIS